MSKIVLVSTDLLVASRLEHAAGKCGWELVTAAPGCAVSDECRVVLIDLRTPGLDLRPIIMQLRQRVDSPAIVAFGPHVHEQSLARAREAGCDLVVTRGQLERDAEAILAQFGRE